MEQIGYNLLHDPRRNKGTAFTKEERKKYKLEGLLPEVVETLKTQLLRINEQVERLERPLNKYVYLLQLLDNNETLFFRTIMDNPVKYMPIIYTPTVGDACTQFGHIFRRPRGMYISINDKGNISSILKNWPQEDVRFTVVTDGERILGLGDLGMSGMGIPIGKLCLYTACAGVPPEYTLPVVLDAGTNNESLLSDPLYPGLRMRRVKGKEYDEFIDEFVSSINEVFPDICIQWEDFAGTNAIGILEKYREKVCCFNDDIQGTAGVIVSGMLTASKVTGKPIEEHRFLFLGAGAAAVGIADLTTKVLIEKGLTKEDAYKNLWLFDSKGLVVKSRTDLKDHKKPFAKDHEFIGDFLEAIRKIKPTAIIGLSTQKGAFTEEMIELMSELNEKPIIFPCSNPTSHSECTAQEAYDWSGGRAVFASGSPFSLTTTDGKIHFPSQGNNIYIFPAMGLAIYAAKAKRVTDGMFIAALHSLSNQVTKEDLKNGLVFPPLHDILKVAAKVAADTTKYIFDNGLAGIERPNDIESFIKEKMYKPDYR
ncbi:MAG: NAD-dependent malic enzyme [Ignavibacteria bacterium]|nr:NAD-dependent malic enzyme [Ignavibacteria bacterium]